MKKALAWIVSKSRRFKIILFIVLITIGWFAYTQFAGSQNQRVAPQTSTVKKSNITVSVTASGTVSTANNTPINTQVSGVITNIYAKNGDEVMSGAKILDIELDQPSKQKYMQALAAYQNAKNSVDSANANSYSLRAKKDTAWKTYYDLATGVAYQNSDGTPRDDIRNSSAEFQAAQGEWLAAEANIKNQQNVVNQAQTALSSAWYTLQESSPTLYAPISGTVSGLSVQEGSIIATKTDSTSGDSTTSTAQKLASIQTNANPTVSVSLTEIDVVKVKIGDVVKVTLDAFADKSYSGTVLSIDTVGAVSSGVTTYPTVIALDKADSRILTNMSASATITTDSKNNVLVVPSAAVSTENGRSTVRTMQNGRMKRVSVQTGLSSDTEIEIISGLKEGDIIITGTAATSGAGPQSSGTQQRSVFSPAGGFGGTVRRSQ